MPVDTITEIRHSFHNYIDTIGGVVTSRRTIKIFVGLTFSEEIVERPSNKETLSAIANDVYTINKAVLPPTSVPCRRSQTDPVLGGSRAVTSEPATTRPLGALAVCALLARSSNCGSSSLNDSASSPPGSSSHCLLTHLSSPLEH